MENLDQLLDKAKWDKLSPQEIDSVVMAIKATTPDNDDDLYTLLHILGRSEAVKHKELVEKFLYYPSFPMISGIALRTLCIYWGLTKEYLDPLKRFIQQVDWDPDEDVRLTAIQCARNYLGEASDEDLLKLLLNIFYDEGAIEPIREAAYEAVAMATGQTYEDMIKDEKPNPLILEKAKQMIKNSL
jgi:hypothetical protein